MKFKDCFLQEQGYLRQLGDDFVKDDPRLAPFLGSSASDPDVEYLMEHFAFLATRLVMKVEDDLPELTHPLLQLHYPNALRPLPSMTLIQFRPVDHALSETQLLPKGTAVFSRPIDGTRCEFRTCEALPVAPLEVRTITLQPSPTAPRLRIDLNTLSDQPLQRLRCASLRFQLGGGSRNALTIYQWLAQHLHKLYLHVGQRRFALPGAVTFVGFEPHEALCPGPNEHLDGHRTLEEFFCYPERFHGFRIDGLDSYWPDEAVAQVQLEFCFDAPLPDDVQIDPSTVLLNCIPAINLFSRSAEPIALGAKAAPEPVRMRPQDCAEDEIFSLDQVSSQPCRANVAAQIYQPFEAIDRAFPLAEAQTSLYYRLDIEHEPVNDKVIHKVALVQHNLEPCLHQHEQLNIELTCSNGNRPQRLGIGDVGGVTQDTPSFVTYRNLTIPTRSYPPLLQSGGDGKHHWALISNLSPNDLSLSSPAALAAVIKAYDFVGEHDVQQRRRTQQRLDAITQIHSEPCDWLIRGLPVRGKRTTLHIDPAGFECEGELQLFGNVLSHFMALYASSHSFHQLQIVNTATSACQQWPALSGRHAVM
ncbi:type VI secretion system baseplate subunit TssF [Pseudomonas cremoricolorata]|uniref:type VI secretion system baseplate subunit TssF n=1 Tax=Pseudomonas cremoricolorata TaxID=157783 RepID=UPI0004238A61|nr:type VI secretion system baseplate subunit TssF [Pseudomonas cremoricolorata]